MTIEKAIERIRMIKSGYDVSDEVLLSYIDRVESMILTDIVSGREGGAEYIEQFGGGIDLDSDRSSALFAPRQFEDIYAQFAAAQIDLLAEDGDRYLNDMAVFRDTYLELKRHWWQTHRQAARYGYHD